MNVLYKSYSICNIRQNYFFSKKVQRPFWPIFRNTKSANKLPNYIKNFSLKVHFIESYSLHLYNNKNKFKVFFLYFF